MFKKFMFVFIVVMSVSLPALAWVNSFWGEGRNDYEAANTATAAANYNGFYVQVSEWSCWTVFYPGVGYARRCTANFHN